MRRLWLTLVVLALVAGPAVAQPAKKTAALAAETDAAQKTLTKDLADRTALATKKAALARRYETELAAVDRLKQQRKSWRRDRQLQDAQARALDTSKELGALTAKIAGLDTRIAADKRVVVKAIDAELPGLADGTRKRTLTASRAATAPPPTVKSHKIVVPDSAIDPLADPEELDQQAQALRATEAELARQIEALDGQTRRLLKTAELVKAHERAGDLVVRDDEQPRRTGSTGGTRVTATDDGAGLHDPDTGPSPSPSDNPTPPPSGPGEDAGMFQGEETAQVLSEVIDPATGDALRRAGRTSDPKAKAQAAKLASGQVAARLEALRKQRAAVEARARSLRDKK